MQLLFLSSLPLSARSTVRTGATSRAIDVGGGRGHVSHSRDANDGGSRARAAGPVASIASTKRARPRVIVRTAQGTPIVTSDALAALNVADTLEAVSASGLYAAAASSASSSPSSVMQVGRRVVSTHNAVVDRRRRLATLPDQVDTVPTPLRNRKPHGYWNSLSNLEAELRLANGQLGFTGRCMVPRIDDLKAISRGDVVAALMKHGGVKAVAAVLRWQRAPSLRSRTLPKSATATSTCAVSTTTAGTSTALQRRVRPMRPKVQRRPVAYWADVSRVHAEMGAFIDEFGTRGVMPTRKQLYMFGRADLANAAMRHGGLLAIAQQMNLKGRKDRHPRGYWREFDTVRKVLVEFSDAHCPGVMPTSDELTSKGLSCLVNAIANHGGFPSVAKRCELRPRNSKKQGAPVLWDEARVRREYLSFLMTYYPQLALERVMVGERQLRFHGRNDLSYAIGKFGGFTNLGHMLELKKRVFKQRDHPKKQDDAANGHFLS